MANLCSGRIWLAVVTLAASGLVYGHDTAYGETPTPAMTPPLWRHADPAWTEPSRTFVCEAYRTGLLEVNMSRVATLRAISNEVRQFARRLASDHERANRKLKEIAWSRDIPVCEELDYRRATLLLALQRRAGDDFDREYLAMQVDQHRRLVRLFQQQSQLADEELRDYAGAKLPALEAHLRTAAVLADSR